MRDSAGVVSAGSGTKSSLAGSIEVNLSTGSGAMLLSMLSSASSSVLGGAASFSGAVRHNG